MSDICFECEQEVAVYGLSRCQSCITALCAAIRRRRAAERRMQPLSDFIYRESA
jgi:hypothetical protein